MTMHAVLGAAEQTERGSLRGFAEGPAILPPVSRRRAGWSAPSPARALSPLAALDGLKQAAGGMLPVLPPQVRVARARFEDARVALDPDLAAYRCWMSPSGRPAFTPAMLRGLGDTQRSFLTLFEERDPGGEPPFRYVVFGSDHPGVFNLGGDLALFAELIRAGDREGLAAYATACVDVVYANYAAYGLPVVTIGLVEGDALGGGFEAALTFDVLIAERGVRFGLPEVAFNLFPGMGAFSFLSRKLGAAKAQEIIGSGRLYDAQEMAALGIVDILVEPGEGEAAVRAYIARNLRRHNAQAAMFAAARRANAVPYEELIDIVDLWVEAAFRIEQSDLRRMERLVAAQDKRRAQATAG